MYEMQRPRPVSRHRPADCSASFAPLDRLPGAVTLTGAPVARITSGSGVPLAGWVRVFSLPTARGCPRADAAKFLFAGGSECRLWPVARGFPYAGWLGVSSHLRPEVSPCRVAPDLSGPEGPQMPVAGGSGLTPRQWRRVSSVPTAPVPPLRPRARGNSHCRVAPESPLTSGQRPFLCRVAPGFPPLPVA